MKPRATPLGDIERHFWLSQSVARTIGINLSEAMAENRLTPKDYTTMITRCRAQGCQDACQRWLAAQTTETPNGPPEYCANSDLLKRLSATH